MLGLCVLINLLIIVYFAVKRWRGVALCYTASLALLLTMVLLPLDHPAVVQFLSGIFGSHTAEAVAELTAMYAQGVVSPYVALQVITFLIAFVLAAKTVETVYTLCKARRPARLGRCPAHRAIIDTTPRQPVAKKYIFYCSMLC